MHASHTPDLDDKSGTSLGDFEPSYAGLRLLIGLLGLLLPVALVMVDYFFLKGTVQVRGSMSAYYHSGAHDIFVGGLGASGVILIGYLSLKWTWDYWVSLVAGVAVLVVANFPTARAGVQPSASSCGEVQTPTAPACAAIQTALGEDLVRLVHAVAAAVVVISFAALCFGFALQSFRKGRSTRDRAVLFAILGAVTIGGGVWATIGPDWPLPHAYVGEFIAFTAFGAAWMVASWDLLKPTFPGRAVEGAARWMKRGLQGKLAQASSSEGVR